MATRDFSTTPLVSGTLEGGFLELATLLQKAEVADSAAPNNIQLNINTDTGVASITASIPVSLDTDASGNTSLTAVEYVGV